jgi:hypothetical protein
VRRRLLLNEPNVLDMQGLGGPDEDRSGGFERGGWVTAVFDNEAMAFLNQAYERADAFLFGRRTYEIFAG